MAAGAVIPLTNPAETSADALTEILRQDTRGLLQAAVEAEASELFSPNEEFVDAQRLRCLVRHGHLPERAVVIGTGKVLVRHSGFTTEMHRKAATGSGLVQDHPALSA